MELAYRLAVDESPYIKNIRNNVVTLITPIVEVDGRDRMVDVYRWHLANPGKNWPEPALLGEIRRARQQPRRHGAHAHADAERAEHLLDWHAQVLHDLHESVPYLYDNTVGDGPYNAWIDPILAERVADDRLEQRQRDDEVRHAWRFHARQRSTRGRPAT